MFSETTYTPTPEDAEQSRANGTNRNESETPTIEKSDRSNSITEKLRAMDQEKEGLEVALDAATQAYYAAQNTEESEAALDQMEAVRQQLTGLLKRRAILENAVESPSTTNNQVEPANQENLDLDQAA